MRIAKTQVFTRTLANFFKLKLAPFKKNDSIDDLFLRGQRFPAKTLEDPVARQYFYQVYGVSANESNVSPKQVMDKVFNRPWTDLKVLPWRQWLAKYDHYSLQDWIRLNGVSPGMADLMGVALNIENIHNIALTEFIMSDCFFLQNLDMIVGGKDLLPRSFWPHLRDNLVFNAKVSKIKQTKFQVDVTLVAINCLYDFISYLILQ